MNDVSPNIKYYLTPAFIFMYFSKYIYSFSFVRSNSFALCFALNAIRENVYQQNGKELCSRMCLMKGSREHGVVQCYNLMGERAMALERVEISVTAAHSNFLFYEDISIGNVLAMRRLKNN